MYYIYCYTNNKNNHKYVGQTNNIDRRKREHHSASFNKDNPDYELLFHKKLREYGEDNFSFEILEEINTEDMSVVNQKEQYWIKEKNSYVRYGQGYNLTLGGEGVKRVKKISLKEALEIIELLKTNISYQQICEKYNLISSYISMINQGMYFHMDNETYPIRKYFKEDNDYFELVELLKYSNLTLKQIAEKLNIGYSTVKKINQGRLRKNLSTTHPIREKNVYQMKADRVKELLMLNYSNKEIKEETGISDETIRRINFGETHKDNKLNYPLR